MTRTRPHGTRATRCLLKTLAAAAGVGVVGGCLSPDNRGVVGYSRSRCGSPSHLRQP